MRRPPRPIWRLLVPAVAVVLVVAVALAETLPGGRSGHAPAGATTPTASAVPNTQLPNPVPPPSTPSGNTISGRSVTWLGMQIATENGTAVIQTVQLGSPADAAGLDPGDVIQMVNRHSITAADQISGAVRSLRAGDAVQISVARGSTFFATVADFAGRPTISP